MPKLPGYLDCGCAARKLDLSGPRHLTVFSV
jgi:hypothetical protein